MKNKYLSARVSRVSRLCPIFRAQPGAYPPETQNRTLRRRAGVSGRATAQKPERLRAAFGGGEAASGEQPAMDLSRDKNAEKMN